MENITMRPIDVNIKGNMNKGISLVELIVAVGILATLAVTGTTLLFGALRGTRKADAVINVRSEGAYAMQVMTSMLRYAYDITACSNNKVTFVPKINQLATSFSCEGSYIASNSAKLTATGVLVSNCTITCDILFRRVDIKYTVSAAQSASAAESAQVNFDSQIVLRNKE